MEKLLKKMGILLIFFAPLDSIKIINSYLSLFRITLLVACFLLIISIIANGKVKKPKCIYHILFLFFSDVICICLSKKLNTGIGFFINDCTGIVIVLYFMLVFEPSDIKRLLATYVRSQYIVLVFTLYTWYLKFVLNARIPNNFNFLVFSLELSENQLWLASYTGLPYIFLPYASAPHLALSVGIAAIICFYMASTDHKLKDRYTILGLSFLFVLLATFSKGPIIAMIISLIIFLNYQNKKSLKMKKKSLKISIFLVCIVLIFVVFDNSIIAIVQKRFMNFLRDAQSGEDRHILLVFEAIRLWLTNIKSFIFGIGYASISMQEGYYTWIPETFLCSFATILAERGLFGFVMCGFFYFRYTYKYFVLSTLRDKKNVFVVLFFNINVLILICLLFYELRYLLQVWVIYAVFAVSERLKKEGNYIEQR